MRSNSNRHPIQELLKGLKEPDYADWKHHPVTKALFQYLADYRQTLRNVFLSEWEAGKEDPIRALELRGRIATLGEITQLNFADIESFYSEAENGSEVGQDGN